MRAARTAFRVAAIAEGGDQRLAGPQPDS